MEGGFVTTNDPWLYTRAQSYHDTAACWRPDRYAGEQKAGELFCGENYRMSELQGAVAQTIDVANQHQRRQRMLREGNAKIRSDTGGFADVEQESRLTHVDSAVLRMLTTPSGPSTRVGRRSTSTSTRPCGRSRRR